eukprot:CAMPEP_0113705028 /NCGR_PEP_ID=MMETSP0038_2-20120614/26887_1 /TAXON_ID=2898 /ORGANISM="Cryptomonas paramecium" /LENGTH=730 /DNA_ID=CAMNT_0000629955 /DNA_START=123 /DNA_END=2311 /DNA_ORIENTATION=- /assembly_acc=CAM_ASM_000170
MSVGYDLGCDNDLNYLTGKLDCSPGRDRGCPLYYHQVCDMKLPPYMAMQVMCTSHADCVKALEAPLCGSGGMCVPCSYCQIDKDDSIDGVCPQTYCNGSGGWPRCLDGDRLTRSVTSDACPSQIPFAVWNYHDQGTDVEVVPPRLDKIRTVTPGNYLIGPVVVTQRRNDVAPCHNAQNPSVRAFFNATNCLKDSPSGAPYGKDPTFLPSSSIYNGKLQMPDYYDPTEIVNATSGPTSAGINVTTRAVPLGFFPQGYRVNSSLNRPGEEKLFRLYFDPRLAAGQADTMVSYLQDGGFIDSSTKTVTVEFVSFNPALDRLTYVNFDFDWKPFGSIVWDFDVTTFSVDMYSGSRSQGQLGLEVVSVFFLAVTSVLRLRGLFVSFRTYKLANYFLSFHNYFHSLHIALMWYGWYLWWGTYAQAGREFVYDTQYPVIVDPEASSRLFQVDPAAEARYLEFLDKVRRLASVSDNYLSIASFSAFLFVFSLIEAFRFQPQLGLLTRTLEFSATDLMNFALLFFVIFGGYSAASTLLFGHQVLKVSNFANSLIFNSFTMVTLDYTQFWSQFEHAAPAWVFHLWTWSFVLVVAFGLYNVLMAMLIEGLVRAKDEQAAAKSVPAELGEVCDQAFRSAFAPSKFYMSDSRLKEMLEARQAGLPPARELEKAMEVTMGGGDGDEGREIAMRGGVTMSFQEINMLLVATDDPDLNSVAPGPEEEEAAVPVSGAGFGGGGDPSS